MKIKPTTVTQISSTNVDLSTPSPLYVARPSAGFPMAGDDAIDKYLNLSDLLVKNPASTFFIKVEGDSMEGAKIFSGDVLVVDRSVGPVSGAVVVAAIYGEMVVKRLKINKNGTFLVSENVDYEPILVTDNDDCFVWGVVVGSARVF